MLLAWIEERVDQTGWGDGRSLHADFVKWCDAEGEKPWSRRAWSIAMEDRGYSPKRKINNGVLMRGFEGATLRLAPAPPMP